MLILVFKTFLYHAHCSSPDGFSLMLITVSCSYCFSLTFCILMEAVCIVMLSFLLRCLLLQYVFVLINCIKSCVVLQVFYRESIGSEGKLTI